MGKIRPVQISLIKFYSKIMKMIIAGLLMLFCTVSQAQHTFTAKIQDADTEEPLPGATAQISGTSVGSIADTAGLVTLSGVPSGSQVLLFSFVGYKPLKKRLSFPLQDSKVLTIKLESQEEELEEIVVNATRGSRTLDDIPTRVEVLAAEELTEKAVMNSANIAMLLRESTGIQMQQTSASSANQSIRIQGLDGRYTQIIQDGFPLYGGFAGGLSIMQIPPLDLQQVEVIKGSASTLYGGGAIAGLINLVTRKPGEHPELDIMLNQTSASGTTLNGFYAQRLEKTGLSLYTSANRQSAYDPEDDNFSNIPEVRGITVAPRFFYYPDENTTIWAGLRGTSERRTGGNMQVLEDEISTGYTEENLSNRLSSQLQFSREYEGGRRLVFKNSFSYFDRSISLPDYSFQGEQLSSFSEANYSFSSKYSSWIAGLNLFTDKFDRPDRAGISGRDFGYQYTTAGAFIQNNMDINPEVVLESGLRADYNFEHGLFLLPRVSMLYKITDKLSSRIGGGPGYKLPGIFTEDAERLSFRGVQPLAPGIDPEKSLGANFDVSYQTALGDNATFSLNQLFFYTALQNSLMLEDGPGDTWFFSNSDNPVRSKGFETNARFTYFDFKLFLQYAFIDARPEENGVKYLKPLTPRHNAGAVLVFEQHGKWRIGYELYYTGPQYLSDRSKTPDYWIMGLMGLRQFERFSLFLNFENFLDARQTRYGELVYPPASNPRFAEIWAPTDGFVVNGGFIINLFPKEDHH